MHRIDRAVVELRSREVSLARALSERVRRMHGPRIAPVLDRVCGELGAREALFRIERLDLDLGTFAVDGFEDAFIARLEPALRAALAEALRRRTTGDERAEASLELLETFAFTGNLPWWAPQDRDVVARHFARATIEAEADLVALLGRIAQDPGALDRIARTCGGREAIVTPSAARASAPSETSRLTRDTSRRRPLADPDALDQRHARAQDSASSAAAGSAQLPAGDGTMAQPASETSRLTRDTSRSRQRTDPDALEERLFAPPLLAGALATSPRMATGTRRVPPAPVAPAAIRTARRGALARLDELYVADAGLVILWPFLERFFLRAGVLGDDRRFLDDVAQLQAVALVESLATADPAPLEFHLPLAKLLCGRSVESDFVLERPLAPEQLAEGDHLLAAVIDRAPAPAELSIPSFRAGFLARPGALGTRDGAWLLQVERRPHDVVLARFPWSWGWIKLPWMPEPLRVEW
jgi:hypothetical protein